MSQPENLELNLLNNPLSTRIAERKNLDIGNKIKILVKYFVIAGLILSTILTLFATAGKLGGPPLVADSQTSNLNNLSKLLEALQTASSSVARFRHLRGPFRGPPRQDQQQTDLVTTQPYNITERLISDLVSWENQN